MQERATEKTSSSHVGAAVLLLVLLMLPALYVFSVGPVARAFPDPPTWLRAIYDPLIRLARTTEATEQLFRWYLELWVAR